MTEGIKQVVFPSPRDINELHTTFKYWLSLTDEDIEAYDVILTAALDRDIPGDPFWLYIVAPPGGIKTEFTRSLILYPRIYPLDSLTENTFISGKVEKNKETGEFYPVAGILESLDGKVLVIKDFTVILSFRDATRTALYGQLRAIHDGYFERAVGTLPEPIRVKAKLGLIAAVTPAIDMYTKAHNILGERFLKVRLHPNQRETTERAFKNLGQEEQMRKDLSTATANYLKKVRHQTRPQMVKGQRKELIKMAIYIAFMRTRIKCHYYHGRITDLAFTEPEVPTRVVKQLKKLAIGLALVRQHRTITNEDMRTVKRVAKDSSIPNRQKVVEALGTFVDKKEWILPFQLQSTTKLPLNTIKNELEKMTVLDIVEEKHILTETKKGDKPKEDYVPFYRLTQKFLKLYEAVK